jgi:hypothetical protein
MRVPIYLLHSVLLNKRIFFHADKIRKKISTYLSYIGVESAQTPIDSGHNHGVEVENKKPDIDRLCTHYYGQSARLFLISVVYGL